MTITKGQTFVSKRKQGDKIVLTMPDGSDVEIIFHITKNQYSVLVLKMSSDIKIRVEDRKNKNEQR